MDITNAIIVQKTVNAVIERVMWLRYGDEYVCPYLNYDVKKKAPLDDYLKLLDHGIDVKKEDLYSCVGGEPKEGEGVLDMIKKNRPEQDKKSKPKGKDAKDK